jgi:hypothetical protein
VNDGLRELGRIYAVGSAFLAVTGSEQRLGEYATLNVARAAIMDATARERVERGVAYKPTADELVEARAWRGRGWQA